MAEPEAKKTTSTPILPDWSQLPEGLLELISTHLENSFEVVHVRSVCSIWRSTVPLPSSLLRPRYRLPTFPGFHSKRKDLKCIVEKVSLFLFTVLTPPFHEPSTCDFFLGGVGLDKSDDETEDPSPLECSLKVKMTLRAWASRCSKTHLINIRDTRIVPLGDKYRIIGGSKNDVAILPLDKKGKRGEYVVLLTYYNTLLVLTSAEKRWKKLENIPTGSYTHIVTYKGRFFAVCSEEIVVIDPYSLQVTLLLPPPQPDHYLLFPPDETKPERYLVPSGNDQLFLVEILYPLDKPGFTCRVSRLDEEAGKWVEVSDLGDRVLFIGKLGNVSCSAEDLPHGCGLIGNSVLFTNRERDVTIAYTYGVSTEDVVHVDDYPTLCWRASWENRVQFHNQSLPVVAFCTLRH